MKKYDVYVGIDPGVKTGFAVWNGKEFISIQTTDILYGFEKVSELNDNYSSILVRVEDARLRTWFGKSGREVLQGVGSVKRETALWELFLQRKGIDYEMVHPKNNKTKLDAATFKRITGYVGTTSEHSRDAGGLVYAK